VQLVSSNTWRFTEFGLKLGALTQAYAMEIKNRYPENVIRALLDSWFFEFVTQSYGRVAPQEIDRDEFLAFIQPAYKQLAGIGGYCLVRPLVLCSNILSLCDSRGFFLEYDRAVELLEDTYQSDPTALHYTIDRYNTDYQIKLDRISGGH